MESLMRQDTLADMQVMAALRNGKCLSDKYWNNAKPLTWQCEKGHIWEASSRATQKGAWCAVCKSKNKNKGTIEDMQKIAEARNGKCLSVYYVNQTTKLQWQCEKGHVWNTTPGNVKEGCWCPYCAGSAKLTIEDMHALAQERNGKCLSNEYVNSLTKLQWQCEKGHIWNTTPGIVKEGCWCPVCAGKKKHNDQ